MVKRRRYGSQIPTFSNVGEWAYSDGKAAVDVFNAYGVKFYKSQEYELEVFLARDDQGDYPATTICISKPRQNGKSFAARYYAIWMAAIEGKNVLFTAHHGKTVRKMFKEICNFVTTTPDFSAMLKPSGQGIYKAQGSEGVYFVDEEGRDAGMIEFQTRTNAGARGETYQVIISDEAQEITDEQLEAMKPTTFAASDVEEDDSDPQMIFLGTPPGPKCSGTVFLDYHNKAHEDPDTSIWWMEWAVDEIPDMSDKEAVLELVYKTNPAVGYRIKESTMREAIDSMTRADGFARECLGWWSKVGAVQHVLTASEWDKCKTDNPPKDGITVFAVKFAPDGSTVTVAACLKPEEGMPYVEVVRNLSTNSGIAWLVDWLVERKSDAANIVIDGRSYAETLNDKLLLAKVSPKAIIRPTAADMAAACATLTNAVKEQGVAHFGQPGLDASAVLSVKREITRDGGFGFESTQNADATLIEACALALWQALRTKRNPKRKQRVG